MNEDLPVRPANMLTIVAINQGKRPVTMGKPHTIALKPGKASEMIANGDIVVDTRSEVAFGSGHIPGAYNIQLSSPEFEQRVGWVTPLDVPVILVVKKAVDAQRAMDALAFVGLDQRVKGYLAGGMEAWIGAGMPVKILPPMSVEQVRNSLQAGVKMHLIDVRETSEWAAGHIESAHHLNYKHLRDRIGQLGLTPDDRICLVCAAGARASTAGSILLMSGFQNVSIVTGGMQAWAATGFPMVDAKGRPL